MCVVLALSLASARGANLPAQSTSPPIPGTYSAKPSSLQGQARDAQGRGVADAKVTLSRAGGQVVQFVVTNGEGIFRFRNLAPGTYDLAVEKEGFRTLKREGLEVRSGALLTTILTMEALSAAVPVLKGPAGVPGTAVGPEPAATNLSSYPVIPAERPQPSVAIVEEELSESQNLTPEPDRWKIQMPEWTRYEKEREPPYIQGRWYDPFNRNRFKGDYPIFG